MDHAAGDEVVAVAIVEMATVDDSIRVIIYTTAMEMNRIAITIMCPIMIRHRNRNFRHAAAVEEVVVVVVGVVGVVVVVVVVVTMVD